MDVYRIAAASQRRSSELICSGFRWTVDIDNSRS
jgi:hypothetical protein